MRKYSGDILRLAHPGGLDTSRLMAGGKICCLIVVVITDFVAVDSYLSSSYHYCYCYCFFISSSLSSLL